MFFVSIPVIEIYEIQISLVYFIYWLFLLPVFLSNKCILANAETSRSQSPPNVISPKQFDLLLTNSRFRSSFGGLSALPQTSGIVAGNMKENIWKSAPALRGGGDLDIPRSPVNGGNYQLIKETLNYGSDHCCFGWRAVYERLLLL